MWKYQLSLFLLLLIVKPAAAEKLSGLVIFVIIFITIGAIGAICGIAYRCWQCRGNNGRPMTFSQALRYPQTANAAVVSTYSHQHQYQPISQLQQQQSTIMSLSSPTAELQQPSVYNPSGYSPNVVASTGYSGYPANYSTTYPPSPGYYPTASAPSYPPNPGYYPTASAPSYPPNPAGYPPTNVSMPSASKIDEKTSVAEQDLPPPEYSSLFVKQTESRPS